MIFEYIIHNAQLFALCSRPTVLGIGTWYKYIPEDTSGVPGCNLDFSANNVGTVWLIVAGITDILLRVTAYVAIGFFIYGAFRMVTSQGSPEGLKAAKTTMVNAIVGLILSVVSAQVLVFVMTRILGVAV